MIKIELKTVKSESGADINYVDLCNACLKAPARQGFSVNEMKVRLGALKEFPQSPKNPDGSPGKPTVESVEVSTEVYQELLSCINVFRWSIPDQVIVDFIEYIESLAKTEPKK